MNRNLCLAAAVVAGVCTTTPANAQGEWTFIRGDANRDGRVNDADAVTTLGWLFTGATRVLTCRDAADSNDDGTVDITDPINTLHFLFNGTGSIPAPFPGHGVDPTDDQVTCGHDFDARTSVALSDPALIDVITLEEVLTRLADENGNPADTALSLFQQMWAIQSAPTTINGFAVDARPTEASLATENPFDAVGPTFIPIGLFNRFDLAPADGAHCGEHRVIFGMQNGIGRNFIIFEAQVPNPNPSAGRAGCRKLIEYWASLSDPTLSDDEKRLRLTELYFTGIGGVQPAIRIDHFSPGRGQIRTNQFMSFPWSLREFKLIRTCPAAGACDLDVEQVTVKDAPPGELFGNSTDPRAAAFQSYIVNQTAHLASATTVNEVGLDKEAAVADGIDPTIFDGGEHQVNFSNDYDSIFVSQAPAAFQTAIQSRLDAIGSSLTPADIVRRYKTQSCAGCHQLSNFESLGGGLSWTNSLGFVMVSEFSMDADGFRMAPALTDHFIPARFVNMNDFLHEQE